MLGACLGSNESSYPASPTMKSCKLRACNPLISFVKRVAATAVNGTVTDSFIVSRARLTTRMLQRKIAEYQVLEHDLAELRTAIAKLRQRVQEADAETLLEWSERILTAEAPEPHIRLTGGPGGS